LLDTSHAKFPPLVDINQTEREREREGLVLRSVRVISFFFFFHSFFVLSVIAKRG